MRVLVTGATSMIGACTVRELLRRGHEVHVMQRGESELPVQVFRGDIRDSDVVRTAIHGCDVVIHAAAKVGLVGSFQEFFSTNVTGTENIMNAAEVSQAIEQNNSAADLVSTVFVHLKV